MAGYIGNKAAFLSSTSGADIDGNMDVDGNITADGLTVSGDAVFTPDNDGVRITGTNYATLRLEENDTTDLNTTMFNSSGAFSLYTTSDDRATLTQRLNIDHSTGDISFYEDTGTTAKLFWDASAESLGIGTSSLDLVGSTTSLTIDHSGGNGQLSLMGNGTVYGRIFADNATGDLKMGNPTSNDVMFYTANLERMRIDSTGNVGIGTSGSTPSRFAVRLDANNDGNVSAWSDDIATFHIGGNGTTSQALGISGSTSSNYMYITSLAPNVAWKNLAFRATKHDFLIENGSSHKVRVDIDGLKFNGDTAAANALDDYEEGTYDPTFSPSSGSVTVGSYNTLSYIKIGRFVRITGMVNFSANTAGGSMSMSVPFASTSLTDDSERSLQPISVSGGTKAANEFFIEINPSASGFFLKWSNDSTGTFNNAASEFSTGYIYLNFNYTTT